MSQLRLIRLRIMPPALVRGSGARDAGFRDGLLELPEGQNGCVRRDRLEARDLAGTRLTDLAEVGADHRRDLRVPPQTGAVDVQDDWLDPARHLDAAHRDRVVDDIGWVGARLFDQVGWPGLERELGPDVAASHPVGGRRELPIMAQERVDALGEEQVVLRAEHDPHPPAMTEDGEEVGPQPASLELASRAPRRERSETIACLERSPLDTADKGADIGGATAG